MQIQSLEPWLVLSHLPGMRSQLFNQLLDHFKTPEKILACEQSELKTIGLKPAVRQAIGLYQQGKKDSVMIDRCCSWLEHENHHIVTLNSSNYPRLLKQIPDPPPLLYVLGDKSLLLEPQIAMVGSRKPSPGGRKNARIFAGGLSRCGYVVCSGMALGIDYESHVGALENNEKTIAVLGTGVDCIYPKQNTKLAKSIIEKGLLISELPLGTRPNAWNFPQRNRIISGLSHGVVVVEAALRSGSLITARFANEQGREVFAIPGSIHNPNARGCHQLISQGAKLVENLEGVLEELNGFAQYEEEQVKQERTTPAIISTNAKRVLDAIDYDPTQQESISFCTGLQGGDVSALITELELMELIVQVPGGYVKS